MNKEIAIIMGSKSDFAIMQKTASILNEFSVDYEIGIVSAHRTPDRLYSFAKSAKDKGIKVIIAAAGGAAHLPGMVASLTTIPVIGVPINSSNLSGLDSLLSIVQMPFGIPVATMAIGEAGAKNAAIMAISILSISNNALLQELEKWRQNQTENVPYSVET